MVNWELHGMEFGNCNCDYGCPCQFNALPTHGQCRAVVFFRIDRGHFGKVQLDGRKMALIASWPGPVHQGQGTMQPVIDVTADSAQRDALLKILTGQETDPMATFFAVYAAMCSTIHEPVFTEIVFDADMEGRMARCEAVGIAIGRGEPIRNPVTLAEHRVRINLPNGFEYLQNEVGRGWSTSLGKVPMKLQDTYAQWCELHLNRHGVIHEPVPGGADRRGPAVSPAVGGSRKSSRGAARQAGASSRRPT
jgi:hypothetical protein